MAADTQARTDDDASIPVLVPPLYHLAQWVVWLLFCCLLLYVLFAFTRIFIWIYICGYVWCAVLFNRFVIILSFRCLTCFPTILFCPAGLCRCTGSGQAHRLLQSRRGDPRSAKKKAADCTRACLVALRVSLHFFVYVCISGKGYG